MNIYEKLAGMRYKLSGMNIRKSGKNAFAGYDYYELGDIVPPITELEMQHKVVSFVTFLSDKATLTLVNAEKPDEMIVFESPMADATLKGAHAIQNLGAVETYQRRYLYMAAYNIAESDFFDATQGKNSGNASTPPKGQKPDRTPQRGGKPQSQPKQQPKTGLSQKAGAELRSMLNKYMGLTGAAEKDVLAMLGEQTGYNMKTLNDAQAYILIEKLDGWVAAIEMEIEGALANE